MLAASVASAAETVKIYNWSSYIAPDTLKNFQQASGIVPTYDVYDSNETLDGKLMTGNSGYDVVFPSNHFMARQIQGKALKRSTSRSCPTGRTSTRCCSRRWRSTTRATSTASVPVGQHRHRLQHRQGQGGTGRQRAGGLLGPDLQARVHEQAEKLRRGGAGQRPRTAADRPALPGLAPQPRPRGLREGQGAADEVRPYVSYFHSSKYTGDLANGDICVVVGFSGMCCRRRTAPKRRRTA
jgi:putrescine transport system substrate-binding protein